MRLPLLWVELLACEGTDNPHRSRFRSSGNGSPCKSKTGNQLPSGKMGEATLRASVLSVPLLAVWILLVPSALRLHLSTSLDLPLPFSGSPVAHDSKSSLQHQYAPGSLASPGELENRTSILTGRWRGPDRSLTCAALEIGPSREVVRRTADSEDGGEEEEEEGEVRSLYLYHHHHHQRPKHQNLDLDNL